MVTIFRDLFFQFLGISIPLVYDGANPLGNWNPSTSTISCLITVYIIFANEILANNILMLFSIERVIVLYLPFRSLNLFTQRKALIISTTIFVFSSLISIPSFVAEGVHSDTSSVLGYSCYATSNIRIWSQV